MSLLQYLKESFGRKRARKITREYPPRVDIFDLAGEGRVEFANWTNPLVQTISLSQHMVDFFRRFIREGDLVIDIGANIGDTTVPMALAAGPSGVALAFDPNPLVFRILQKNATLNPGRQHIVPLPFAISTREEEFYYVSSEASFANGGLSAEPRSRHGKYVYPQKVRGVQLKTFLEANYPEKLERLTFIKVDAEGYDKEILKSIAPLLARYRPVVVAESFAASSAAEKAALFEVIAQHGYDVFYFGDFDTRAKVQKIDSAQHMANWKETINIYGVPRMLQDNSGN